MKINKIAFFSHLFQLALFIAIFHIACSDSEVTGTISETEHGVLGEVVFSDGSKEAGIPVVAFTSEADSARAVDTAYTDNDGKYRFNSLSTGLYNFEAKSTRNSNLLIAFAKKRFIDAALLISSNITFEADTFKVPATLKGQVTFADSVTGPVEIYLYGTHYRAYSNSDSTYELYPIPSEITFDVVYSISGYGDTVYYSEIFDPGEVDIYDQHLEADNVPPEGMVAVQTNRGAFEVGKDTASYLYNHVPAMLITAHYSLFMDQTEVTQKEFTELMSSHYGSIYNEPDWSANKGDSVPAYNINWFEALLFCNARSAMENLDSVYAYTQILGNIGYGNDSTSSLTIEGLFYDSLQNGYRLPLELEWHISAITESYNQTNWYWGNSAAEHIVKQYAWYRNNAFEDYWTTPHATTSGIQKVGQLLPNNSGLYDMFGNVYEWCYDWYDTTILGSFSILSDYEGPTSGELKVLRGGSYQDDVYTFDINKRKDCHPTQALDGVVGFRCVRRLY